MEEFHRGDLRDATGVGLFLGCRSDGVNGDATFLMMGTWEGVRRAVSDI